MVTVKLPLCAVDLKSVFGIIERNTPYILPFLCSFEYMYTVKDKKGEVDKQYLIFLFEAK